MTEHDLEVLLVHGSMHGAWCWDDVIMQLGQRGVAARAIDLPGHGQREAEAALASMAVYAQTVIEALDASHAHKTVLVGHSMAGQIVARAATNRPGKLHALVFLNAQVLTDGETHLGTLSAQRGREYRELARKQGGIAYKIHDDDFHTRWLQDLPRDDPRVARALQLSTPQPFRPLLDHAVDQDFGAAGVPAVYLRSTHDVSGAPARTQTFLANLPAGTPVRSVAGGHDCMISAPEGVAAAIAEIASSSRRRHDR